MSVQSLVLFLLVAYIIAMSDAFATDAPSQPRSEQDERLVKWSNRVSVFWGPRGNERCVSLADEHSLSTVECQDDWMAPG